MEFFKYIETALGLKPRQGWIFLLAGAALLALNLYGIWPFNTLDALTLTIAAILLVLGAVIQVVEFGDFIREKIVSWNDERRAEKVAKAARDADEAEAVENLVTLTNIEARQLVWILRAGHQRTSEPVVQTLVQKNIVQCPDPFAPVRVVTDSIWAKRDEILKDYEGKIPREGKFPYTSSWI
jgi:hypothetical protein